MTSYCEILNKISQKGWGLRTVAPPLCTPKLPFLPLKVPSAITCKEKCPVTYLQHGSLRLRANMFLDKHMYASNKYMFLDIYIYVYCTCTYMYVFQFILLKSIGNVFQPFKLQNDLEGKKDRRENAMKYFTHFYVQCMYLLN